MSKGGWANGKITPIRDEISHESLYAATDDDSQYLGLEGVEALWEKLQRTTHLPDRDDKSLRSDDTQSMNDITREEFNAKIETIEARMDSRVESVSSKIDAFLTMQAAVQVERDKALAERDKAQLERDKRYELLAERVTKAAEGSEEAAKQAATVKSNYWAAVIVQLLAVVAILVGAYYANQANVMGAMQTTMSAFQAGKAEASPPAPAPAK